jgi:hypothetical protein
MATIEAVDLTCAEVDLFLKEWSLERIKAGTINFQRFCYLGREYLDPEHPGRYLLPNVDTDDVFHALQKTDRGKKICRTLLGNLAWKHIETPKAMSGEEREQWEENRTLTSRLFHHHFGIDEYFDELESSMRSRCGFTIAA